MAKFLLVLLYGTSARYHPYTKTSQNTGTLPLLLPYFLIHIPTEVLDPAQPLLGSRDRRELRLRHRRHGHAERDSRDRPGHARARGREPVAAAAGREGRGAGAELRLVQRDEDEREHGVDGLGNM